VQTTSISRRKKCSSKKFKWPQRTSWGFSMLNEFIKDNLLHFCDASLNRSRSTACRKVMTGSLLYKLVLSKLGGHALCDGKISSFSLLN
jgi:hypothetical protein